jgi:hypothetical protein
MNRKSKLFFLFLKIFRKMVIADSRENQIYELVNQKKKEIDGKI